MAQRITADRRDLDYLRVFVSTPALVGRALGDLVLPGGVPFLVIHVRRGDADMLARPDLVLEFGDRVGLLTNRDSFPAVRKFFERILERLEMTEFNTDEFVAEGDTVVIFGSEAGTVRATGQAFRNVWSQKYVVRDGLIVEMAEYNVQVEPRE